MYLKIEQIEKPDCTPKTLGGMSEPDEAKTVSGTQRRWQKRNLVTKMDERKRKTCEEGLR